MKNKKAKGLISGNEILLQSSNTTRELLKRGFGIAEGTQIYISAYEALYLMEKEKLELFDINNKEVDKEQLSKRMKRSNRNFLRNYIVFKDLRSKGYNIKTGAKYGTEFRAYEKGVLPGKAHAKWLIAPAKEDERISWQEILGKNRIANSTKKRMLLAIVDNDNSVTYIELKWTKP